MNPVINCNGTLLLNRSEIARLLSVGECIDVVERAFAMHGAGLAPPPGILGLHSRDGGLHIKAGLIEDGKTYFVAKVNANFPENGKRFGLPTIQGVVVLSDGENGYPLAVMDSIEITIRRTGAATAVAAKYLARSNAKVLTICGCGEQGRIQLQSLLAVCALQKIFLYDLDPLRARALADQLEDTLSAEVITVEQLGASVLQSDICVTCTTSKRYIIESSFVAPGTFIAGVGADNEQKQELDPQLFVSNKIVADVMDQSATLGDLHHAIKEGYVQKSDVHAELGEIVAGRKPGRTSESEITIFDSTGMALQDAVSAVLVYRKAVAEGIGTTINFN